MSAHTTTGYTKAQAKAHDAELAEATKTLHGAHDRTERAINDIHRAAGDTATRRRGRTATWTLTLADAIATATRVAAGEVDLLGRRAPWELRNAPQRAATALAARDAADAAEAAARTKVDSLEEIWRDNGRWSRFFMVPAGHIHRATSCHTLRATTKIGWLPELSGESDQEAVTAYGTVLCTHCFPDAPVEWTTKAPKALDPSLCPGSAQQVPGADMRLYSPRGTCPECGNSVSVTSIGNARKHKP